MTTMLRSGAIHTIGQPHVPNFADPLGLMAHCHRKIETYLKGLLIAGDVLRGGTDKAAEAFRLIDAAREHFAVRGPKHTEDEEVSLFPRLREHGGAEAEEALSAVAELEAQHRAAEQTHAEFDSLVGRLPRDGSAGAGDINRYAELAAALSDLYRPHIRVEDELVFPAAARVIPPSVLAVIGGEMRARRRDILRNVAGVTAVRAGR